MLLCPLQLLQVVTCQPCAYSDSFSMLQGFVPKVTNLEGIQKMRAVLACSPFFDFTPGQEVRQQGHQHLSYAAHYNGPAGAAGWSYRPL